MIKRLALVLAGVLATVPWLAAMPAEAAPAAQPSWCGWHPANDSHDPGWVTYSFVNIRTGQGTQCNTIPPGGYDGDYVVVHCYNFNGAGQEWYYLWDSANNTTGWVIGESVIPGWNPVAC